LHKGVHIVILIATVEAALPQTPINVVAVATDGQATIKWDIAFGEFNRQYTVIVSPGGITGSTPIGSPAVTTLVISGLGNDVAYSFSVFATNFEGS
jgi:hypothetical protein